MARKSAKYIAEEISNFSTSDVYECWKDMGFVIKDKFNEWILTDLGKRHGGKMSKNTHTPVPTFDADKIIDLMISFCKEKTDKK